MEELIEKALQGDNEALISLFYSYGVGESTVPDRAVRDRLMGLLAPLLDNLPEREQFILKSLYGIGCEKRTLAEIGEDLEFTQVRVRQIKEKALRRLKSSCRSSESSE
jgi:RNA polymerase primary sigma factor